MNRLKALYASAKAWADTHFIESVIIGALAALVLVFVLRGFR